jgi:H+/Cl- antiporter ClcA
LIIFFSWYCLTIITYGTFVPAGLFLPGMIVGCALGALYADVAIWVINEEMTENNKSNF